MILDGSEDLSNWLLHELGHVEEKLLGDIRPHNPDELKL
jgi:hypothetical protein